MLNKLIETDSSIVLFILRTTLGIVIFGHGAQKLLGIWGGHGPQWTVEVWQQWWGIPPFLTYIVIAVESIGALMLILGFIGRIISVLITLIMLAAVYLVHIKWGFYMNWYMQPQTGEGFEYHMLIIAIAMCIIIKGSGTWSLDIVIGNMLNSKSIKD